MTDKNGTFQYETTINSAVSELLSLGDVCCLCQLFDKLGDKQEVHRMTILVTQAIRSDCGFIQLFILLGPQWLPLYQPQHCVKLTSLIPNALEINLTHPANLSAQKKRMNYKKKNQLRCHHFLKGSLQL